ncbi:hypothetical protein GCM10010517_24620 [Streptosporangium fragile]|uniref:Uncharacterized protein n=1 Tax=Streptosporangium fragile TaxID=46186 RepID=A0ABN3VXZ3_9ACTN
MQALLAGELDQGRVPHRAGEVQVQMGLGQFGEGTWHFNMVPYRRDRVVIFGLNLAVRSRVGEGERGPR